MTYNVAEVILKVENVNLTYDKPILRDINFEIHNITRPGVVQGQIVSLIGRSGIGKTQLFKILSGLHKPDSGSVRIGSELRPVKAGDVGVVPQNYILFNHRTITDNFKIALKHTDNKLSDKEKEQLIKDYAATFDLSEHLKKYPMQLSGGQRQRVSIIQQVFTGNKFILLDEPFSGLDAIIKDKVTELLLKIANLNEVNTLVLVSHDIESCLAISDTAFIIAKHKDHPGATITETLDLMKMGFAWDLDIKKRPAFQELVGQIKYKI